MRLLLVEDDLMIGDTLVRGLKVRGYTCDWLQRGDFVLAALREHSYDGVILDLGLPGCDGLSLLQALRREKYQLPVIIISARDSIEDRILGLDLGADDYLIKPFSLDELFARIRALGRRPQDQLEQRLSNGVIYIDLAQGVAGREGAQGCSLSARELALLQQLMKRPGQLHSRAHLEEKIYGWGEEVESNAVEFIIHALRKKLGSDAIKNVRGLGWMVVVQQ